LLTMNEVRRNAVASGKQEPRLFTLCRTDLPRDETMHDEKEDETMHELMVIKDAGPSEMQRLTEERGRQLAPLDLCGVRGHQSDGCKRRGFGLVGCFAGGDIGDHSSITGRAIAAVGVAQGIGAVGAAVLETFQLGTEPLHEYRAGRKRGPEPVAIAGHILGQAKD
jgi:hypothetical protein